ncbi:winged helix-turn-helix domain-containing protein [Serratia quinivorans]|uniref:winged helix-turn-helix domain-containing protein n=1 Tax=Serratia quinivorans TaxID=137545 RepID=UPI003F9E8A17
MKTVQYRIEGDIFFCPNTLGFYHQAVRHEIVSISAAAARLFAFLLQNRGEIVERDILLKKVWDDYGMQSSNNNLNQCLSTLRRIIKTMGVDKNIIETIPKIGLRIADDVDIEEIVEQAKTAPVVENKKRNSGRSRRKNPLLYGLMLLVALLAIVTTVHTLHLYNHYKSNHFYNDYRLVSNENCEAPQLPALFTLFGSLG